MSFAFRSGVVNTLTLSRVPLIFAFMIFAVWAQCAHSLALVGVATLFMFLSAISDLLDGKLARRWQVVSQFGKLADPLMDKVFFIVAFPTLLWLIGVQNENRVHALVMLAFTVLYVLRDQWVTFLRAVATQYQADISAMWLGKVRTALSFPIAGAIYLYLALHQQWGAWVAPAYAQQLDEIALMSVYALEGFLIVLNVYSCVRYTHVYGPYLMRALKEH